MNVVLASSETRAGSGLASNQFDEKSKKQWSDQLQDDAKSMRRRKEQ